MVPSWLGCLSVIFFIFSDLPSSTSLEKFKWKTRRPTIAVLDNALAPRNRVGHIAASYVRWIEQGGGKAVPMLGHYTNATLKRILRSVNGVVLVGGASIFGEPGYYLMADFAIQEMKAAHKRGEVFPIWGTCLGFLFGMTNMYHAEKDDLRQCNIIAENVTLPETFKSTGIDSQFLQQMPDRIYQHLASGKPLPFHAHSCSVLLTDFYNKVPVLQKYFRVVSTSFDKGTHSEFVSMAEGRDLPIYLLMWHPEKHPYEWNEDFDLPHNRMAVELSQYTARFFVNQCRRNSRSFDSLEELENEAVDNQAGIYMGRRSAMKFDTIYAWDRDAKDGAFDEGHDSVLDDLNARIQVTLNEISEEGEKENAWKKQWTRPVRKTPHKPSARDDKMANGRNLAFHVSK